MSVEDRLAEWLDCIELSPEAQAEIAALERLHEAQRHHPWHRHQYGDWWRGAGAALWSHALYWGVAARTIPHRLSDDQLVKLVAVLADVGALSWPFSMSWPSPGHTSIEDEIEDLEQYSANWIIRHGWRDLMRRQGDRCPWCGHMLPDDRSRVQVDHIVPKAEGGPHRPQNLQVLHRSCNISKGTRPMTSRPTPRTLMPRLAARATTSTASAPAKPQQDQASRSG